MKNNPAPVRELLALLFACAVVLISLLLVSGCSRAPSLLGGPRYREPQRTPWPKEREDKLQADIDAFRNSLVEKRNRTVLVFYKGGPLDGMTGVIHLPPECALLYRAELTVPRVSSSNLTDHWQYGRNRLEKLEGGTAAYKATYYWVKPEPVEDET